MKRRHSILFTLAMASVFFVFLWTGTPASAQPLADLGLTSGQAADFERLGPLVARSGYKAD